MLYQNNDIILRVG